MGKFFSHVLNISHRHALTSPQWSFWITSSSWSSMSNCSPRSYHSMTLMVTKSFSWGCCILPLKTYIINHHKTLGFSWDLTHNPLNISRHNYHSTTILQDQEDKLYKQHCLSLSPTPTDSYYCSWTELSLETYGSNHDTIRCPPSTLSIDVVSEAVCKLLYCCIHYLTSYFRCLQQLFAYI